MGSTGLKSVLDRLNTKLNGNYFDLKKIKEFISESLNEDKEVYDKFISDIRNKWESFQITNKKSLIKISYTAFLDQNFPVFIKTYLSQFFKFNEASLKLVNKEKSICDNLYLEYFYYLSPEEMINLNQITKILNNTIKGTLLVTGLLYFIVATLGMLIRKTLNLKIFIALDAGIVKSKDGVDYLDLLIMIRESNDDFFYTYIYFSLYYFLKEFKGIPDKYYDNLLEKREKLFNLAIKNFKDVGERVVDLLYYFYRKCVLLQNVCPLLDLITFVCSHVENSIFIEVDIIKKEFLDNFNYTIEKKSSILRIFDLLDKKSALYSTFQANNLPSLEAQLDLFLLFLKYYFSSGLEALEVGDLLYLPKFFKEALNSYNLNNMHYVIDAKSIKNIGSFANYFSILSNYEYCDEFFLKVFNKKISELNYRFFRTFLNSFNAKLLTFIEKENQSLKENPSNIPLNFDDVIDHICRILYVLIEKIFLTNNLDEASNNFRDSRGRYTSKNIAKIVSELFLFQEFNFSDDIWSKFLISLNKSMIKREVEKYIPLPDNYFYTDEQIIKLYSIYSLQSFSGEKLLEQWLIEDIVIPLHSFIENIKRKVKNPTNRIEIYEKLVEFFITEHQDKEEIQELKSICQQLSQFWLELE